MIRAAGSMLKYSHLLKRRAKKFNWQFVVERREFAKFANELSRSSAKAATFPGPFSQILLKPHWHASSLVINRIRLASADLHREYIADIGRAAAESESKWRRNEGKQQS